MYICIRCRKKSLQIAGCILVVYTATVQQFMLSPKEIQITKVRVVIIEFIPCL